MREALRALRNAANSSDAVPLSIVTARGPALELAPADASAPRLESVAPIEGDRLAPRSVGSPEVAFAAFLDGIQRSVVIQFLRDGAPVVLGTVAAVVRCRSDGALHTWRGAPRVSTSVFAPTATAGSPELDWVRGTRMQVVDTLEAGAAPAPRHPAEFLALARTAVQARREELETGLAESWCDAGSEPLYIDGGISGAGSASRSRAAVGVVKSHRTLYTTGESAGESLRVVTGLDAGSRTTSFEIRPRRRNPVASWYLRLRDARGRDPLFGLVRVEVARDTWSAERADEVSRWILAERSPVSLPDPRWSTMAYGIRDCEEYLRALTGA